MPEARCDSGTSPVILPREIPWPEMLAESDHKTLNNATPNQLCFNEIWLDSSGIASWRRERSEGALSN
jgi:hypothetical protein